MFILAINGSPRKNGRVTQMVEAVLAGAACNGHLVKQIFLADMEIADCKGCMSCQQKGYCAFRDDIAIIEEDIRQADIIVWASPTHWGNLSALSLKVFERLFGFFIEEKALGLPNKRQGNGKKAILITACSTASPFNWMFNQSRSTINRMREVCRYSGQQVVAILVLPGTFAMKEVPYRVLQKARRVGAGL
ncbi:MAG: flavodoxin family protein [Deltaproteobacteria bacterium]